MTEIEILKAFLEDSEIQEKYGLSPMEVTQMTMSSRHDADAQVLVDLIRRMIREVEDKSKTVNVAAAVLNAHLENVLH